MIREDIRQELERLYTEARKVQDSLMKEWSEPYSAVDTSGRPILLAALETQARILDVLERMSDPSASVEAAQTYSFHSPEPILRTPSEWETLSGIRVLDADGWNRSAGKYSGPRKFTDPITHDEFNARVIGSTVDHPKNKPSKSVSDPQDPRDRPL